MNLLEYVAYVMTNRDDVAMSNEKFERVGQNLMVSLLTESWINTKDLLEILK